MVLADQNGNPIWRFPKGEFIERPIWTDGKSVLTLGQSSLRVYQPGKLPPLPLAKVERKALAKQLVANLDQIDLAERHQLKALGPDAFSAVFEGLLQSWKSEKNPVYGSKMFRRSQILKDMLHAVTKKANTHEIIAAITEGKAGESVQPWLLGLLAIHCEPDVVLPLFLKEIDGSKTPAFKLSKASVPSVRQYIAESQDPRAISFMIGALLALWTAFRKC